MLEDEPMMISTKGRYALRVMIDLAEHRSDGYIPLKEIAQRQEISEKYLESILKTMKKIFRFKIDEDRETNTIKIE